MAQVLAGFEPKDGDLTPDSRGVGAVVSVSGVHLVGEREQACVLGGVGHLGRHEVVAAKLTLAVDLQVVGPLRMFGPTVVGCDENGVAPVVEVRHLYLSWLPRFGAGGDERCVNDQTETTSVGKPGNPRVESGRQVTPEEQSRAGAAESSVGLVDWALLLVRIDVPQRHVADPTSCARWTGRLARNYDISETAAHAGGYGRAGVRDIYGLVVFA